MSDFTSLPSPVSTFYAAFQRGDLDAIRGLYKSDASLRDPGIGFLLGHTDLLAVGVDNIARYYFQAFSNMPEAPVLKLLRSWSLGNDVIVEYTEGMMTYLEIFSIGDGKIAGQQVFWGSIPPAPLLRAFNAKG